MINRSPNKTGCSDLMETQNRQTYYFADVEIDTVRGSVRRGGKYFYLRPKTFQVLVYLIEHRDGDVSKNKIISDVWKDTAVVDDVLVQSVKDIRRTLDDSMHSPRFIRTIPKVGYRFIAEVQTHTPLTIPHSLENLSIEKPSAKDIGRDTSNKIQPPKRKTQIQNRAVLFSILLFVIVSLVLGFVGQGTWQKKRQTEIATLAKEPHKKSLAVMFFENQSQTAELDWLREGLADMLIAGLSRSDKLTVLSRGQLRVLLDRNKSASSEKIQIDEALEIAQQTGAEAVMTGTFARLGERLRVDVQLYDAKTGQIQTTESLTLDRAEQILSEIDLLSLKLANRLNIDESNEPQTAGLSETMTKDLEAYRYYSLGVEQAEGLHNKEAVELFEKAIARDPQFALAHARIGYAYAVTWNLNEKGKPYLEKAFQLSEKLTEKDRLNIAAWYSIANFDYQIATEQFRHIIDKYPQEIEAYFRLARLLQGEGQLEEAISVFQRGLAIDPNAKNLYNGLGGVFSFLGRHDEAIATCQHYVALAQNEPNAYDTLGMIYQWAGNYPAAIENYNHALELNPKFDVAIVHLANTRFQLGQYQEAISLYQRYIENAPSDQERMRGYMALTTVYLKKRDLPAAEKASGKLTRLSKDQDWFFYLIALKKGKTARAKALEKQVFSNFSSNGRGGKISSRPEFYSRGYIALKNDLPEEAISNFQEAVAHHLPRTWEMDAYEDCLANAYLDTGRIDEAIGEYERILRLNPNYPLVRFHIAQAYEKKGLPVEALENYQIFLQIWKDADQDIPEVMIAKKYIGNS